MPATPTSVSRATRQPNAAAVTAASYEADPRGAAIEFRKHLGWYVKGLPGSADLRRQLHAVDSLDQVEGIFAEYLTRGPVADEGAGGASELELAEA